MIKYIKRFAKHYINFPQKRYLISSNGFNEFIELKPNSQRLFKHLLDLVPNISNEVTIECNYKDLGFEHASNFYRARTQLIDRQFIIFDDNRYFINPCMVNPYSRRQWLYIKALISPIKKTATNFGVMTKK